MIHTYIQGKNCGSNSRLVVDEDDNGKFRLEGVNNQSSLILTPLGHF